MLVGDVIARPGTGMDNERDSALLIRAFAAYKGVVANPKKYGPIAAGLVAHARRSGDAEALVAALRAQAWAERARLADDRARALLDEAVRVARRHRLSDRLGEVLVTRAAVNHELGRLVAAQRDLDRAAAVLRDGRSAELDLQQAALLQNTGRLSRAAIVYRRVLARQDAPVAVRAIMANNLALIEAEQGRHDAALDRLAAAAELAAQAGPAVVALVAQTRGWVTVQAGRLSESLRLFDRAARLYEDAGLSLGEPYLEHVDALLDLRLLAEATELARRAAEQFEAHGVLLMGAEARLRAAQLALLAADHRGAVAAALSAAGSFRQQRRASWAARADVLVVEARTRIGEASAADLAAARRAAATLERLGSSSYAVDANLAVGRVALALGRAPAALGSLQRAHELARRAPVLVRLKGRVAAALAARVEGRDGSVLRHCRAGLSDLWRHRSALPSIELRARASGHGAELGGLGLEVLLRAGLAARVLDWMERTRAAAMLATEPPAAAEGMEEELAALRVVHAELARARRDLDGESSELLAKQAAIESRVRRANWQRQAVAAADGTALSTAELRALLDGRVLVEYGVLDGQLVAAVLEPRRTRVVRLGPVKPVQDETEAVLFSLRRLTRPGPPAVLAGTRDSAEFGLRRLTGLLLHPLELAGDAPLVVVPSGHLRRIPWSALHPAPLSVAPSASLWARTRRHRDGGDGRVVLVAGPDLPGATAEVEALRDLHARPAVLAPPESGVAAVVAALDGAALAHLACHGRLRADNPMFSSLLLSDGPLTVQELDLRGIAPHRIILAACDSAADVWYEGDEMLGFVSALLARGTAGLVASTILVPDLEVVPLMRSLHELAGGGATLGEALHAARAMLDRERPGAFVSWCAFIAFGAA
jgi:CHAT domain-containing protein/tetratricopeptide (TPR) repeat protein